MTIFNTADAEDIKSGKLTDVYFQRTQQILEENDIDKQVKMEVRLKTIPQNGKYGVLAGLDEVRDLLQGTNLDVWSLPEGSVFESFEPVMVIKGPYREFSPLETPLLGFLCQAGGIATKASRVKLSAGDRPVFHFGARRIHPSIAPMVGRSAYLGGCDGVAVTKTADMLGLDPVGTIPHALVLILEDSTTATGMFKEVFGDSVKCVALVDTFGDEKFEALENADVIGDLDAIRLDTPSSRRGNMEQIAREVRWELDLRGYEEVEIFVSGGLDEAKISALNDVADAYGVGTSISNAPVLDFALDIVEIEGDPVAKRGKKSGAKQLYVCAKCGERIVRPWNYGLKSCPSCGNSTIEPLTTPLLRQGEVVRGVPDPGEIRDRCLSAARTFGNKLDQEKD